MDVQYDFRGKVCMVSGGSRGIGFATAQAFVQAGASAAIAARTPAGVEEAVGELEELASQAGAGGQVLGVAADLSEAAGAAHFVDGTVGRFGGADILVNCAGGSQGAPFLELADEPLLAGWQLKLLGAIRLTRAMTPIMEARGGGAVVSIGGGAHPGPDGVIAATTCSAMQAFTRAVASDLAPRGISINIIHPGSVRTRRLLGNAERRAQRLGVPVEQVLQEQAARIPTGHVTEPDEIASLVLFLASQRVVNLTGAEIVIDGGAAR